MEREETERIVESVKRSLEILHRGGARGDVFALDDRSVSFEIRKGEVTDAVRNGNRGIGIRVLEDGGIGFGYTVPGREEKGVKKAVELSPLSEEFKIDLPKTEETPEVKTYQTEIDEKVRNAEGIELASQCIDGCVSVSGDISPTRGEVSFSVESRILGNTEGAFLERESTFMNVSVSATLAGKRTSLSASQSESSRRNDLDAREVGRTAGEKVDSMRERAAYEGGRRPVVLSPDCLAQLLYFSFVSALYGENVRKGRSVYEGKLGERVASRNLEVFEDPTLDWGLGSGSFDDEGVGSRRIPIVSDGGVLQNFLYDLKEAGRSGAQSTSDGVRRNFMSPPETSARNFVLKGGEEDIDEILQSGSILVDNVMGAHTANPVSGEFSVVINPGWVMDDGEKRGRLDGAMISGNLPELLKDIELGKDYKKISLGTGSIESPPALLKGVTVSGRG